GEGPRNQMMNHVGPVGIAEQRNDPAKKLVENAGGIGLRIKSKAGEDLHPTEEDDEESVSGAAQGVVAKMDVAAFEPEIVGGLTEKIAPPTGAPHKWETGAGVIVAGPKPVDAHKETDDEDDARGKMDLTDAAHDEVVRGLTAGSEDGRSNIQACQEQYGDAERVDPMRDANGQLPDVGAAEIGFRMGNDIFRIERLNDFCHSRLLDANQKFGKLAAILADDVRSAGEARVEGVNGAQDFQLALGVLGRSVPCRRNDDLVIGDLGVLDMDPVTQGAAGGFGEAVALGFWRPGGRLPPEGVRGGVIAGLQIGDEVVELVLEPLNGELCFQPAGSGPAERGEERGSGDLQGAKRGGDHFLEIAVAAGEADEDAGQRAYFHGVAFPARRFQPGILGVFVELGVGRRGAGVLGRGLAVPRMERGLAAGILVPRMRNLFLDLAGVGQINRENL